jgi:hypothetical protein
LNGRKIVFVNQAFGFITIDIVNEFAKEFDKVAVIYGDLRVQDVPVDSRVILSKVVEKSRKSHTRRFIRWFVASLQIFFLLLTKYRRYEIFYFSVPPFAYLGSLFIRHRFSLLMWDVYPDALKIINVSENNVIYRWWASVNRKLFKRVYRIYTIGESLAGQMAQYISHEKIEVIPLWTGLHDILPVTKKDNQFIAQQGLEGKFIVLYSGNIGPTYPISSLIEAASFTSDDPDIVYLVIGRGTNFEMTRTMAREKGLANCMFLPFQPDEMLQYVLSASDISVVMIDEKVASASIPSKVYNLLAVGSPLLTIAPDQSEISNMVKTHNNGRNFPKDDIQGIASFIKEMKYSPEVLTEYSINSSKAADLYTPANAKKYLQQYLKGS